MSWTKEHARFIGRIIFADFLELPLEKYKCFIEKTESSPFFDKRELTRIKIRRLSRISTTDPLEEKDKYSPKVVAKIVKRGKIFSIKYTHRGFNKIYDIRENSCWISEDSRLIYKLRRITSRNELTHRIIKAIIKHQREYLKTGNPIDLAPFSQIQLPIDNSWTSRLVNRLSAITPSGEEKPLKWFFQTQKDINKRYIKQLFEKRELTRIGERELTRIKIEDETTDREVADLLKEKFGVYVSRRTICCCRKELGILPFAKRRLGDGYLAFAINFSQSYSLTLESVAKCAPDKSGVYEFSIKPYTVVRRPNGIRNTKYGIRTTVFYIGSTRNIRKRLREHLSKNSKNGHIKAFLKKAGCSFRYIQFSKNWKEEEGRLCSLFISTYGALPKCNNRPTIPGL